MTARRVTIVYGRVGGGHLSVARALQAALLEAAPDGALAVDLADVYGAYARPPVSWFPAGYADVVRNHPRFWSLFFAVTQRSGVRVGGDAVLRPFLAPGFDRMLREHAPRVVVSVLPAINGLLADAVRRARLPPPTVVVTDFCTLHRSWRGRGVGRYLVPTDCARLDLVRYGEAPRAIDVTGLPVRPAFVDPPARTAARTWLAERCGLDPRRFTVVVMVGAEGSPAALDTVRALAQLDVDAQVVVACGHDARLRARVAALRRRVELRALGFVTEAAHLMRAADVLVSKAGAVSLAEAFCCQATVVVADVLPGQETGNLNYLLAHDAVAFAGGPQPTAALVASLARSPARRAELAARGARLARPGAAACIARELLAD